MNQTAHSFRTFCAACAALCASLVIGAHAQNDRRDNNVIGRLARQLDLGETTIEYREDTGYLPSLLERLHVSPDSQVLVFSKTSFQQMLINPRNPRALYYGDSVSIGMVPGGEVYEIAAVDPDEGLAFYTFPAHQTERPRFQRRGVECLFCHGPGNKGAPGMVVASVYSDASGTPAYTGSFISTVDHRTAFDARWGGWYVTGTHGAAHHMGNAVAPDPDRPFDLQQTGTQNVTSLEGKVDVSKYLAPTSDIVALMTLEHQVGAANRMNALTHQYRRRELMGPVGDAQWKQLDADIDDLVGYLLFVDEAPFADPVAGVSPFTKTFAARGPRDSKGRSVREFDLKTRLFRYPLSFMIYSEAFDAMPTPVRQRVYQRLFDVLSGKDASPRYAIRTAAERKALFEILTDTKQSLPKYWTDTSTVAY
jgi:hypothetical protein